MKAGDSVVVRGWRGVAYRVLGPVQVWEPWLSVVEDVETGEQYEDDTGEGEWIEGDGTRLRVCMVGDDHVREVDASDCSLLEEDDFCHECGQIGCTHDGRERPDSSGVAP